MNNPTVKAAVNEDEPSLWANWLNMFLRPSTIFYALEEVFHSFLSSRPWSRLWFFSPVILVLLTVLGLVIYGKTLSRTTLTARYAKLADAEVARLETASREKGASSDKSLLDNEQSSTYSNMLYRKLLSLNDQTQHTRYVVALQMARSQRTAQARRMMSELAQVGVTGYAPAHAWMAVDLLQRRPLSPDDQAALFTHLQEIKDWERTSAPLLSVYANLLASMGKRQEALDVMRKAAEKDPEYWTAHAVLAERLKLVSVTDDSYKKARALLLDKVNGQSPKLDDFINLASLDMTREEYKTAFEVARSGLSKFGVDNQQLRLLGSEALRLMYRKTFRKTDKGIEFNLGLLDAALKEFPANPNLSAEIALLNEFGVEAPPEFQAVLEQQLANGQASALTHMLLANRMVKSGQLKDAMTHLELSLKHAPNNPVALNNLGMATALTDSSKSTDAEQYIFKAIALDPQNAEYYDSLGQVRLIGKRPLDAIESFEKAIALDSKRIGTRQSMVKAYREAGLESMAVAQEQKIAEQKNAEQKNAEQKNAEQNNAEQKKADTPAAPTETKQP